MPHAGVCDGRGREGGTANVRLLAQSLREAEHDKWGGTAVCLRPTSTLPTLSARCIALSARCIAHQTRPVQVSPSSYLRIQPWSEPDVGQGGGPYSGSPQGSALVGAPHSRQHDVLPHSSPWLRSVPTFTRCCRGTQHGDRKGDRLPGWRGDVQGEQGIRIVRLPGMRR